MLKVLITTSGKYIYQRWCTVLYGICPPFLLYALSQPLWNIHVLNTFLVQQCVYSTLMSVVCHYKSVHNHQYAICIGFMQILHALSKRDHNMLSLKLVYFAALKYKKLCYACFCMSCIQKVELNVIISQTVFPVDISVQECRKLRRLTDLTLPSTLSWTPLRAACSL